MTDPTRSNTFAEQRGPTLRLNYPLADGAQSYAGQFASVNSHAAAADQGQYTPYAALAGQILAGQFSDEALGDASGLPNNNVDGSGKVLKDVEVTGAVDDATDNGKAVWLSDSGTPLTLTPVGTTLPAGIIVRVNGAGLADIWLFGLEAQYLLGILVNGGASIGTRAGNP